MATGSRKVQKARETAVALLIGLGVAGWADMNAQLYIAFVVGVTGADFSFMWGNAKSKEHALKKETKA